MRLILILLSLLVCLMPWRMALAQEVSAQPLVEALVARTPGATLARLQNRPDAFVEEAAGLILGYGGPDGLSAAQIETAIQVERARLRAREVRRLLEADLNVDLAVTAEELEVQLRAASATMRGRLMVWHRAADRNRDGTASWAEIRAHADVVALTGLTETSAQAMRTMMIFDLDGDDRVRMDEVLDAMAMLAPPA